MKAGKSIVFTECEIYLQGKLAAKGSHTKSFAKVNWEFLDDKTWYSIILDSFGDPIWSRPHKRWWAPRIGRDMHLPHSYIGMDRPKVKSFGHTREECPREWSMGSLVCTFCCRTTTRGRYISSGITFVGVSRTSLGPCGCGYLQRLLWSSGPVDQRRVIVVKDVRPDSSFSGYLLII